MVLRTCKHCGRMQMTHARVWWNCVKCNRRNYIKRSKPLKPEPKRKYLETGIDQFQREEP